MVKKKEEGNEVLSSPCLSCWSCYPLTSITDERPVADTYQDTHSTTAQQSHARYWRACTPSWHVHTLHKSPPLFCSASYDFHMGRHGCLWKTAALHLQSTWLGRSSTWILLRCQDQSVTHGNRAFTTAMYLMVHRCHSCPPGTQWELWGSSTRVKPSGAESWNECNHNKMLNCFITKKKKKISMFLPPTCNYGSLCRIM